VARPLVPILPPVDDWPRGDPYTLCDGELTIADAAMVYCDRHPRPVYWFGRGADNPSPINPRAPAGVDQIEKMIGKGATKDFRLVGDYWIVSQVGTGSGWLENWEKSWSVYYTFVDGVKKGSITPTKPVHLADGSINGVLTTIPFSVWLDLARQRGDAGEILSSLLTWYEPPELAAKSPLATEPTVTIAETGSVEPSSPQRRGAYIGELKAFMNRFKPETLARLDDNDIALRFIDHVDSQVKAGRSALKLPQLRHVANQVFKMRSKDPRAASRNGA
jgi:hypothetical protein